jgi:predicted AAA+ superfamily ATPase
MPTKRKSSEISDSDLLEILYSYNPWWQQKSFRKQLHGFKRSDFFKAKDRLESSTILAIVGPRRVGKTVLLYQLIDELLKRTDEKNILFVSLDHPVFQILSDLTRIIKIYLSTIVKNSIEDLQERIYIFFDEIQSFPKWELDLKSIYDLKYPIKFILSGSSSVNILEGSSEALVGRIHPQIMLPIKFRDYIRFKIPGESFYELIRSSSKNMRTALTNSLTKKDPDIFLRELRSSLLKLVPFKSKMLVEFNNYLLYGGYPQLVFNENSEKAAEYLGDYISLTLQKDIRKIYNFRSTDSLEKLFYLLCKSAPHLVAKQKLGDVLGIDKNTLNTYISALKSTFLITESNYFSNSAHNSLRKEKKIFPIDVGIRNLYANFLNDNIFANDISLGEIAEITVATHTQRLIFNLEGIRGKNLHYWQDKRTGSEVDIVVNPFSQILPIEVKYQTNIGNSDLDGLKKFNGKFATNMSLIITKDRLDQKDSIIMIPAWLYLIIC